MRIFILALLFLLSQAVTAYPAEKPYVEGEVLIKYKKTAARKSAGVLAEKFFLKKLHLFEKLGVHHMKLPKGADVLEYIQRLKLEKDIEYAEPNFRRRPFSVTPNDPKWPEQWGMTKAALPDTWEINKGSKNITVAVIDTGVDYTHPDLSANIFFNAGEISGNGIDDDANGFTDDINGWNFSCPENTDTYSCTGNNDPYDTDGHGTHVAGIIGAAGNNETGLTGINWNVTILPVRFMDSSGGSVAAEIKALDYAIRLGARVINASYGDVTYSQAEYEQIKLAGDKGVLFVAAAGNNYGADNDITPEYPASYDLPNILSVAATDANDGLANFSNYGAGSVHLAAPGVDIKSTIPMFGLANATISINSTLYTAYKMEYAGHTDGLTRTVYNCGSGFPEEFPPGINGNIAVIKRGSLTFKDKTLNAMNAGAVAAIIYNNDTGIFEGTLGETGNWIPVFSVSLEDGNALLAMGNPVVTLASYPDPYAVESGTSMAAPFVSGAAALLMAERPNATALEIKDAILKSVDAVPLLSTKLITGGRLNTYRALQAIQKLPPGDQINLNAGWNFVSLPLQPSNPATEEVLKDILTKVRIVWGYDNQAKQWLKYKGQGSSSTGQGQNTLTAMEAGKGYWIFMNEAAALAVSFSLSTIQPSTVQLYEGWNLTGYNAVNGKTFSSVMNSISGQWSVIWNWADGAWKAMKAPDITAALNVPELTNLTTGRAYWIRVRSVAGELKWTQ